MEKTRCFIYFDQGIYTLCNTANSRNSIEMDDSINAV
jgi:hypothetical protein